MKKLTDYERGKAAGRAEAFAFIETIASHELMKEALRDAGFSEEAISKEMSKIVDDEQRLKNRK